MEDKFDFGMNDIEEKRFKDAVKAAAGDADLAYFEGLDTDLPPASVFMTDGGESSDIKSADGGEKSRTDAETTFGEQARASAQVNRGERSRFHGRRAVYTLAGLAACICVVFAVFTPFSKLQGGGTGAARDAADSAPAAAHALTWDTAGDGYEALYSKIEIYLDNAKKLSGSFDQNLGAFGTGGEIAVAESSDPDTPAPLPNESAPGAGDPAASADTPAGYADTPEGPGGGQGTAGSGYQGDGAAQSPAAPATNETASAMGEGEYPEEAPDFSDTNEQVSGVREADIVKTDGSYIYAINSKNLFIVKAEDGGMSLVSKIPQPDVTDGQVYFEMYVFGDRLAAIRQGFNSGKDETGISYPIGGYYTDTTVDIFDISDKTAPRLLHSLAQSGAYRDSRMIDGFLYLITNYYGGDFSRIDKDDPRTYVPLYAEDGEQMTPAPDDIILLRGDSWPAYTMVSGIDAAGSGAFVSNKSIYGESGIVYCSAEAVYFARADYYADEIPDGEFMRYITSNETVLTKATLNAGTVNVVASASVPGTTLNQFSLDEYGGVLRLVTTDDNSTWYNFRDPTRQYTQSDWERLPPGTSDTSNALYTLDAELNILGKVENLAPGERVYSCRFMGDIAYFVTFRQTDPLFSVDVSDPASPTVLGALKIPGFSEYLHPYADGELFGLGRDADEEGRQKGLKLTMFDNSDPANVKEKVTLLIENQEAYSSAETNHKAILINQSKSLIAFPIQRWSGADAESRYLIYSYDAESGFSKLREIGIDTGTQGFAEIRGLFIGNTFYVVGPNQVGAYDMDADFAEKQILQVDENADSVSQYGYYPPGVIMPLVDAD